jgi:hypothetical protein
MPVEKQEKQEKENHTKKHEPIEENKIQVNQRFLSFLDFTFIGTIVLDICKEGIFGIDVCGVNNIVFN